SWINQQRRITRHLWHARDVRRDRRRTARHRLQQWETESLIKRREHQSFGATGQSRRRLAGKHQPHSPAKSGFAKRLHHPEFILVALAVTHAQKIRKW